jgi:hypothetical protein
MDQAPWQEIDVHEGIENMLIILGDKLRNVTVNRDFDRTLPRLWAYGGELTCDEDKVSLMPRLCPATPVLQPRCVPSGEAAALP